MAYGQVCRILTYDVTTAASTLVHRSATVHFEAPNWTAGDDLIVNGDGLLWQLPADGSAPPRPIPFEGLPALNNDHVLGAGGVFLSANDGHIYHGSLRGGPVRKVTTADRMHFLHGVSPDGTTLAYVSVEDHDWGGASLRTIGADGTGDAGLTSPGGVDDGPEYAPAGDWIYFNTEAFAPNAQIARIRPDGTGLERLTFDERVNWFPHLAPDGTRAVYLSYPPGTAGHPADRPVELRLVEGDDWRSARTVVALPGGQGTVNVNSWSPDSRGFAYVEYPRG